MPITPFHFGPGALLHSLAPRQVSFIGFCAANVLIDVESLYNLIHRREPVHAFFHTYFGATLAAAATVTLLLVLMRLGSLLQAPNIWRWRELTLRQLAIGAPWVRTHTWRSTASCTVTSAHSRHSQTPMPCSVSCPGPRCIGSASAQGPWA
jgi:hypothetical protein